MPRLNLKLIVDEDEMTFQDTQQRRSAKYRPDHKPKRPPQQVISDIVAQADTSDHFNFTYTASRHEHQWIIDSLGPFYEAQWIDDVIRQVKGGKEATVYQCVAHASVSSTDFIAAKVYRPRQFRQLKKDHVYREGRPDLSADGTEVKNHGMLHAMQKRTAFGHQLLHSSWIEHEFKTLQRLYAVGVDVPAPYASGNNAILMGFVGDAATAAPTLNSIELDRDEANSLYQRVVKNIELMLANERIHADLSAYNILYFNGQITLIDFPQAINPHENPQAYRIFERDVRRVSEYFSDQGVRTRPSKLAAELWTAHHYRLSPEIHPKLLDGQDDEDRRYWESLQKPEKVGQRRRGSQRT